MSVPLTKKQRLEHLIETMDRPLMVLAVIAVALYLFDLRKMLDWAGPAYRILALLIDFVFVFDLVLKLRTFGREYVQTPWFLIDFLSCLPALDLVATGILPLRAIRFIRGFRILRILRGLRVLRALRSLPAFHNLVEDFPAAPDRRFHRTMTVAMVSLTALVLVIIVVSRRQMVLRYEGWIDSHLRQVDDPASLKILGGGLVKPEHEEYVTRTILIEGHRRKVYFSLGPVEARADEFEFFLVLGMMITMLYFMYIMTYHQHDVSQAQLRGLLNLALPKQVAERFMLDPHCYDRKLRRPATIVFMDFVGFSQTCEELAHDPDRLSSHLEAAMDRMVGELIRNDMIIDKFIGDAVMSFRGGPLVEGTPADHAYRAVRAGLESIRALSELQDPYFRRVKIGGASSDDCLIGAFGTSARLSYTILGDAVNVAARLEPASAQCGTQNLFEETTYRLCSDRPDLAWRRWGQVRVEGRSLPVTVYEAFDVREGVDLGFIATFQRALEAFEHNDFDRARDLFLLANSQREGGDAPSRGYIGWCESLLLEGTPAGWEPVFETHK
ncbi:MAG: adenylate/guanylate cyclase domain-containing protein [Isosphaeraceae bacterium]|nr:adenylate/guanylate cyclase domain-containing protein [Isosphaeraceae bacterium]